MPSPSFAAPAPGPGATDPTRLAREQPLWAPLSNAWLALLVVLLHAAVWTLVPSLVNRSLPFDVLDAMAWGREWQWGYYKHPPLSAWLAELMRWGPHDFSLYLLSQTMVAVALWANWLLGRDLLGSRLATLALMAMAGVHYLGFSSVEFNANVVIYPLWAWATLCGWRALQSGQVRWWLGLGVCCGLGVLGKYVFLLLPAALFLFTLSHAQARAHWRTAGPWLALLVFAGLIAPHVAWAQALHWPTLQYALARGHGNEVAQAGHWGQEFVSFAATQVLSLLPAWLLLRSLGPASPQPGRGGAQGWLLLTLGAGPLLLITLAAALAQVTLLHMWASPFFVCITPLWLAWRAPQQALRLRRFVGAWLCCALLFPALYAGVALCGPQIKHRLDRTSYPSADIAQALTTQWRAHTGQALRIVGGEGFVAEAIAHYSPDRPSTMYDYAGRESLWLSPQDLRRDGALLVWPIGRGEVRDADVPADSRAQVAELRGRFPSLVVQPTLRLRTHWVGKPYTVAVAWAILPPGTAPLAWPASASPAPP